MVHAAVSEPPSARRASPARLLGVLAAAATLAAATLVAAPASAGAAPPPNDGPTAPGSFAPVTAENGQPIDQQAIAELAEATPDPGVPRCLGPQSFARTVWFVVPPTDVPQEITVEASGETLDVLDLAAFVQREGASPASPTVNPANACGGVGSGGADASEEPTAAISLRVPARRSVLIQVGRRGTPGTRDNESAVVSLDTRPIPAQSSPLPGDVANPFTPGVHTQRPTSVFLAGATLTGEDPAEPPCPSLGSVWRRVTPTTGGPRLIAVSGNEAATLTVFSGPIPTAANALDCVNRVGRGELQMKVPTRARKPLWIRLGTDRPPDRSTASLSFNEAGPDAFVVDGGPAGNDPTTGGPGGGLPFDCAKADATAAAIAGPRIAGRVKSLNRLRRIAVKLTLAGGPACDMTLVLVGPGSRVYATARALRLGSGRRTVALRRTRQLRKGAYRLRMTALSRLGDHVQVRGSVRGKLT
jgi:hypothetical protein